MKEHETFIKMRELISTTDKWTKGTYARNSMQAPCGALNSDARCWCVLGALSKVNGLEARNSFSAKVLKTFLLECGTLDDFNDRVFTTHTDVLALLDRAIEGTK